MPTSSASWRLQANSCSLLIPNNDAVIAESSEITADVLKALEHCPTRSYVVVEQRGVSAADYADGRAAPQLSRYMAGHHDQVKSTVAIPDVVGNVDAAAITQHLVSKCGQGFNDADTWFARQTLKDPSTSHALRIEQLQSDGRNNASWTMDWRLTSADATLENFIVNDAKSQDYTVIYITTPQTEAQAKETLEHYTYEMDASFPESVQMELKRDLSSHAKRANSTEGGLFEKYQYFTPGLFMGFAAIIPLFLILLVGIRALTSLEVSYFAFSKEMGPNAQKKQ
jgi:hypothetical protein